MIAGQRKIKVHIRRRSDDRATECLKQDVPSCAIVTLEVGTEIFEIFFKMLAVCYLHQFRFSSSFWHVRCTMSQLDLWLKFLELTLEQPTPVWP
jgi:hypothetical protein